ncbi:uncharacterized protein LOC6572790 [Drosophila mojavensis]|uniref:Uncharacterized protein, isoform B n=1 Tax=Drosophila mojavensis TaxID=7230 RepID=B4K823_DROMO|nr:uncharacterized protein LOC6572790 [Drosophila mojavensis]XP_015022081.1 uncharacterized protein LOC6572790 [Drosophila mojavensis]XP_032586891.1 uncharacterized protein LOC6572790 [Drosophila mojavensis]EDW14357.2 uncharacterized protein Dmoj_GI24217, isoform C [Drosophila mojavensis]KRG00975.1 uncharacterized protein Dmoj_GI24217, isoform B [Drosophila mojavensis]
MADTYHLACEAADKLIRYLQSIRIAEIRQSMEFIGVHQVEIVIAVFIFLALQFTKFTVVLLLACLIAFTIFYMWDTLFPDLAEDQYRKNKGNGFEQYGAGYGPNYGPRYGHDRSVGTGPSVSYLNNDLSSRDARTSALFPPFNFTDEDLLHGDQSNYQEAKSDYFRDRSLGNRDHMRQQRRSNLPGNMTPVGHLGSNNEMRSHRRPHSQMDEYRYMRRNDRVNDPQAFRRMIANEYRVYRPGTATENLAHYRHPHPNDDTRMKRIGTQSAADDRQGKNRRSSEKSTSQKRYPPSELPERYRTGSRENIRRMRNFPQGPSPRASGPPGRFDPSGPHNNADSRGAKRKSDYQYTKREGRWGQY